VAVPAPPRRAVALRGAIAHSPRASAEHLLRVAGALVLVDGYNVAKLGWPALDLANQRERTLDAADDLARRFGTEMAVVFDGSDVIGAHSGRRRLVRVRYSPAGVTADDVIRAEVGAAPTSRAVVVVTNDGAVRRDVAAAGANTVSSDAFLDVALR
jgi:predicted RNA-binding protein with PIN domain